jgi:hypothetical protein
MLGFKACAIRPLAINPSSRAFIDLNAAGHRGLFAVKDGSFTHLHHN